MILAHSEEVVRLSYSLHVSLAFGASSRGYLFQLGKVILEGDIHELETSEVVKRAYLGGLSSHRKRSGRGKASQKDINSRREKA